MAPLLEARHATKVFRRGMLRKHETVALEDFSLSIHNEPPSITAVVGESGSGKTTLARLLLGLIAPTEGEVLYNGNSLRSLSRGQWRQFRRDVQVIFQDPYEVNNPFYKVDHVLKTPIAKFGLARSRAGARRLTEEALQAVGLRPEETLGRYPHQLSGGQRQRVMVARALLVRPRLIVADEPVSMVDASLRATILGSLRQLNQQFGISLIYITHDLTTAYQISETSSSCIEAQWPRRATLSWLSKSQSTPTRACLWVRFRCPTPTAPGTLRSLIKTTMWPGCLWANTIVNSATGAPTSSRCAWKVRPPCIRPTIIALRPVSSIESLPRSRKKR